MKKNHMLIALVVAVVLLGGYFFLKKEKSADTCIPNSVKLGAGVVRLSGDPWAGYAYFRAQDFLKGKSDYKYIEELDQSKRACMMTSGQINFIVTTMDQYLQNKPSGKIVAMIDESSGADALVLNTKKHPYLTTVDALARLKDEMRRRGEKPVLAYTGNSPSDFLLHKLANTNEELHLTDFTLVSVDQSTTAYDMLKKNTADIAVIWEPETSTASAAGYTVALSSHDVPNSVLDVVLASDTVIANQPELVQEVVDAMYTARKNFIANPQAFLDFLVADDSTHTLKRDDAAKVVKGIHLFDVQEANTYLNQSVAPLDETRGYEALENIASLLNLTDSTIQPDHAMINGGFVSTSAQRLR